MYFVDLHPILSNQIAVYADKDIEIGTIVFDMSYLPTMNYNTRYAITLDHDNGVYLDTTTSDGKLVNHSCDPNLEFNVQKRMFIAIKKIKKNEMFTFDYLTTEPAMVEPFKCICGTSKCRGYINGLKTGQSNETKEKISTNVDISQNL